MEITGDADNTYVARSQKADYVAALAKHISINILQDPGTTIPDGMIQSIFDAMLPNLAKSELSLSEIGAANLRLISDDIRPDTIRKEMERNFSVSEEGGKKFIKVNEEMLRSGTDKSHRTTDTSGAMKGKGKILRGLIDVDADVSGHANFVRDKESTWRNEDKSLNEQMEEFNNSGTSDFVWEFEGEKIVPKSLKVYSLSRAAVKKCLSLIVNSTTREKYTLSDLVVMYYNDDDHKVLAEIRPNQITDLSNQITDLIRQVDLIRENSVISRIINDETFIINRFVQDCKINGSGDDTYLDVPNLVTRHCRADKPDGKFISHGINIINNRLNSLELPRGTIIPWYFREGHVPEGWAVCDGSNGTPDLRDKFLMGTGTVSDVGAYGDGETVINGQSLKAYAENWDDFITEKPNGGPMAHSGWGNNRWHRLVSKVDIPEIKFNSVPAFCKVLYIIKL
ncbi:MAG: tail fiber protein [Synechococcaceae cyanobacterium SM2_3_2]|nr:tail fiber protein [Synechococcaceae cyanobacterium SM2_3_2]